MRDPALLCGGHGIFREYPAAHQRIIPHIVMRREQQRIELIKEPEQCRRTRKKRQYICQFCFAFVHYSSSAKRLCRRENVRIPMTSTARLTAIASPSSGSCGARL